MHLCFNFANSYELGGEASAFLGGAGCLCLRELIPLLLRYPERDLYVCRVHLIIDLLLFAAFSIAAGQGRALAGRCIL